jgi:oxalate decarboxylase/phosphoglucose isomerase-like protein (cupin superfamily)
MRDCVRLEGMMTPTPTVRHLNEAQKEVWSDQRGEISFRTAIGDGSTDTRDLCSGVAHLAVGGWLGLHRHAAPEVYQMVTGQGVVILDGAEHVVQAGSAVYIPSGSEHGIRNTGDEPLEFVYVYQTDSIKQFEYIWSG